MEVHPEVIEMVSAVSSRCLLSCTVRLLGYSRRTPEVVDNESYGKAANFFPCSFLFFDRLVRGILNLSDFGLVAHRQGSERG